MIGIGDEEARWREVRRCYPTIVVLKIAHQRSDGRSIWAPGLHAVIESIAEGEHGGLAGTGSDAMISGGDSDAKRASSRFHCRVQFANPVKRLLQGVEFGIFGVGWRAVVALKVVFDRQLPVRGDCVCRAIGDFGAAPAVGSVSVGDRFAREFER